MGTHVTGHTARRPTPARRGLFFAGQRVGQTEDCMMVRNRSGEYAYVDEHVGNRIRVRRMLLGMSQEKLGDVLGLTFQQVQKYEKGANRVSAARLFQLSKIFNVPMSYFFDNVPADSASHAHRLSDEGKAVPADIPTSRESLKLIRAYYGIPNPALREIVLGLIEALADD